MVILFQQSHFLRKIHSNALPFEHVGLAGNENLGRKKLIYDQTFITMGMA